MQAPHRTGEATPEGRPVWGHPAMGRYSEYTATVPYMGGWMTPPTVDASRGPGAPVGPVDPVTGERFPAFRTRDEAERYAKMRSKLR